VNLAVSLHAANDDLRNTLVPVNRRYPLALLAQACARYVRTTGRRLTFEWALIDGVNDRPSDAEELAAYARPLRAHVNLIPLNPTPGFPVRGTGAEGVARFAACLRRLGVHNTVRDTRGVEIDAACGQLAGRAG
jgi:23S rRNA (adenine2503-C2)-methyltransferase